MVTYFDFFFDDDVGPCHPCVNETDFGARSERMISSPHLECRDSCFLALRCIDFACFNVLLGILSLEETRLSPGWKWYKAADELVGRSKFHEKKDLSLVQFLILGAFYSVHEDKPNTAYNISGYASRLCFQFGLHQQSRWEERSDSYFAHMKQRILWTAYSNDRRIALSCGRPCGISDKDIEVDPPI